MPFWRRGGLHARLFLAHLLVIAAASATLFLVTLATAPTLHDRLMLALLGPDHAAVNDPAMAAMEQATNAVFQTAMLQALLLSGGAATLVAVLVSLLVSARIVTPVRQMLAASRRVAAGHYAERVPAAGHDELAALAAEFNTMAGELEAAERRRVALIGDVAHELRTPLATIEGYTEGVLDGVVAPSGETWALIHDEVGRLKRLVNELQELSRAEAKQLALHPQLVSPAELVQRAIARLAPQYAEKGVSLSSETPADLPPIEVDLDRALQVLVNLLGNALRATSPGGQVQVQARPSGAMLTIEVRDSGVGIAAEHLPHLFERFYRVDKARSRALGGHGIGLTVSKALVEAHGGQIWAASDSQGRAPPSPSPCPWASLDQTLTSPILIRSSCPRMPRAWAHGADLIPFQIADFGLQIAAHGVPLHSGGDAHAACSIPFGMRRPAVLMNVTIERYMVEHRDAVAQLSLRAWAPVFASLQGVLDPAVFRVLYPDWRVSQQQAVEAVCDSEEFQVWVALDAGAPVGFVAVKLHAADGVGEVYMIAVDPAAQRRGVGSALMAVATDWMREAGMAVAMVATGGDPGHAPARRAYEKLGFGLLPLAQYYKRL